MIEIERQLETDGVHGTLYHLLWLKNDLMENCDIIMNVPDTIIYRNGVPMFWYYSNEEGFIKKRKKASLTRGKIVEKFLKHAKSDVVAYYIFNEKKDEDDEIRNMPKKSTIKYLTTSTFESFVYDENIPREGILQRFVHPYGTNNSCLQVIWSKKFALFTKKINNRTLQDSKLDVYERCCTFDGPEYLSEISSVKGFLTNYIRNLIFKIVDHISDISFERYKISRIVMFFKEDDHGKIWFLYTNSLRLEGIKKHRRYDKTYNLGGSLLNSQPLKLDQKVEIPENVDNLYTVNLYHPLKLQRDLRCKKCDQYEHRENFLEIKYEHIISEFLAQEMNEIKIRNIEQGQQKVYYSDKEGNNYQNLIVLIQNDKIPDVIRKIHPLLKNEDFRSLKFLADFTQRKMVVCQNCYLKLSEFMKYNGGDKKVPVNSTKGIKIRTSSISSLEKLRAEYLDKKKDYELLVKKKISQDNKYFHKNCPNLMESERSTSNDQSFRLVGSSSHISPNFKHSTRTTAEDFSKKSSSVRLLHTDRVIRSYSQKPFISNKIESSLLPFVSPRENDVFLSDLQLIESPKEKGSLLRRNKSQSNMTFSLDSVREVYGLREGKKNKFIKLHRKVGSVSQEVESLGEKYRMIIKAQKEVNSEKHSNIPRMPQVPEKGAHNPKITSTISSDCSLNNNNLSTIHSFRRYSEDRRKDT